MTIEKRYFSVTQGTQLIKVAWKDFKNWIGFKIMVRQDSGVGLFLGS